MATYNELFPNVYVDNAQNLQIDSNSVSVSSGSLSVTDTSVSTNQPVTHNNTLQLENNIFLKNQSVNDGTPIPAGYVGIGFDEGGIPFFSSPDFSAPKIIDARGSRKASEDLTLELNDEFVLLGGTQADPIIITFPPVAFDNTKVYYVGGIGNFYGQINTGNVDLVLYNLNNGNEILRDNSLSLDTGGNIQFTYNVITADPLVVQWSGAVRV